MKNFYSLDDVDDLHVLLQEAKQVKQKPFSDQAIGKNKSICLLFMNPSLRTRLSSQKAAYNLGMNVSVFEISKEGWQLEFEDGVIMDSGKAEHIKEAAPVIGQYFDLIGVRSFAALQNSEEDNQDRILKLFMKYCGKPVINLESSLLHPLQSFTDLFTIEEYRKKEQPKVVLSWAPHPKALPQAVPNSFVQWMQAADLELVVTHPKGYELKEEFSKSVKIEYEQDKALEGADFVYAKNWSSYHQYGKILSKDRSWTITNRKMQLTNEAKFMHCLPVRRNMIVADEVLDSNQSVVIQQAGNRVIAAQTIFKKLLKDSHG